MRILCFLYPAVLSQGPEFNGGWSLLMLQLMRALESTGECQCHMVTASRFASLLEGAAQGLSVSFVDDVALQRELFAMDPVGAVPTEMSRRARAAQPLEYSTVALMLDRIRQAAAGFEPDLIITFSVQAEYLKAAWPEARIFHVEASALSRNPYPFSLFFDHCGMYGASVAARVTEDQLDVDTATLQLVGDLRAHAAQALARHDPFKAFDFRRRFARLVLLPLQVSNFYSFDEQAPFRTQFEYLVQVLSAAPPDVGVVVTEYIQWGEVLHRSGSGANLEWLRRSFPNLIFSEAFRGYESSSQYIVQHVDGVVSIASNLGYQALLHGKRLGSIATSHLSNVAHDTDFATFFESVLASPPADYRSRFLAWYLERYAVPHALACDGPWLLDYLRRRIEAARSATQPHEACAPIASTDRLRALWLDPATPAPAGRWQTTQARHLQARVTAGIEIAGTRARLRAAAPEAGALGVDGVGYLMLNDTRSLGNYLDAGCNASIGLLEDRLRAVGLICAGRANDADGCARLLESAHLGSVRLVVCYGGRSLHRDIARMQDLTAFCRAMKQHGIPSVLLNMTWHEDGAPAGALLDDFEIVSVPDSNSLNAMKPWRPDARLVPDLSLLALTDAQTRSQPGSAAQPPAKLVVTDHHDSSSAHALAAFARYHELPFFLIGNEHVDSLACDPGNAFEVGTAVYPSVLRDPTELRASLGCITGRYHGLIAALSADVPVAVLASGCPAIEGTLADAGLGRSIMLDDGWLMQGHEQQLSSVEERLASWTPAMHDGVTAYRQRALHAAQTLFSDIAALKHHTVSVSPKKKSLAAVTS